MLRLFTHTRKAGLKAISTPADFVRRYARGLRVAPRAVLCPFSPLAKQLAPQGIWKKYHCFGDIYVNETRGVCFATNWGMGAAAAAILTEVLLALGAREIILAGTAGSLQEEVQTNDIVLCRAAACADGTSPYYATAPQVLSSTPLTRSLRQCLQQAHLNFHQGTTWTTDALLRETCAEIKHYQKQSVLTVEMEAAAVLAVCKKRRARGAAVFVISDMLTNGKWQNCTDFGLILRTLGQIVQLSF